MAVSVALPQACSASATSNLACVVSIIPTCMRMQRPELLTDRLERSEAIEMGSVVKESLPG